MRSAIKTAIQCLTCNTNSPSSVGFCSNCGRRLRRGQRGREVVIGGTLGAMPGIVQLTTAIFAKDVRDYPFHFYLDYLFYGIPYLLILTPISAFTGIVAADKLRKFIKNPILVQVLGGLMGGAIGIGIGGMVVNVAVTMILFF